jgi:hypothetical protein
VNRLLPRVVVALFLGAVTVPLVAWALALFTPYARAGPFQISYGDTVSYCAPPGEEGMWYLTERCGGGRCEIVAARVPVGIMIDSARAVAPDELPAWSAIRETPTANVVPSNQGTYVDVVYGWPLPALHERHVVRSASWIETSGAMDVPVSLHALGPGRTLPVRVRAAPFALDALALGAGWFVLLFGRDLGRRTVRHARGRCPECGYDLAGAAAGCPECGRGR